MDEAKGRPRRFQKLYKMRAVTKQMIDGFRARIAYETSLIKV